MEVYMSYRAAFILPDGREIGIESKNFIAPKLLESNRTPTLTQSIEAACLDIEKLSDKISKFVFSTEGLGETIKHGVTELGKQIVAKIKWLLGKIKDFFEAVFKWFGAKYHKYILDNVVAIKKKLYAKMGHAKNQMKWKADGKEIKMDKGPVYAMILGAMKFSAWLSRAGNALMTPFTKVQGFLNRKPNSPEEAQQMRQEVEAQIETVTNTFQGVDTQLSSLSALNDKNLAELEQCQILMDSLASNLEQSKDVSEGLLKKSNDNLKQAQRNVEAATNAGNSEEINLWAKTVVFFEKITQKVTTGPLLKGIIHRDKEIVKMIQSSPAQENTDNTPKKFEPKKLEPKRFEPKKLEPKRFEPH
jgi:hypothetical protein